ncbi:hypothetical protein [Streptomyces sp. NPDC053367]|uniref:hypothetical protein n=1 Tax=Streptomyces sp. NPDC053367 TaxID=3365700 RepID=UPI0037CE9182
MARGTGTGVERAGGPGPVAVLGPVAALAPETALALAADTRPAAATASAVETGATAPVVEAVPRAGMVSLDGTDVAAAAT